MNKYQIINYILALIIFIAVPLNTSAYFNEIEEYKTNTFSAITINSNFDLEHHGSAPMQIRFKKLIGYSDWIDVVQEHDAPRNQNDLNFFSKLIMTNHTNKFQIRKRVDEDFDFTFQTLNALKSPNPSLFSLIASTSNVLRGFSIVGRSAWKADESLLLQSASYYQSFLKNYNSNNSNSNKRRIKLPFKSIVSIVKTVTKNSNNKKYVWPKSYTKDIKKIVIHHTASVQEINDTHQAMRNLYYYHTVRRGFGDIGYHYVIINGKIFEGRAGGSKVIGAHAYGANSGTVGIAIYGNFENKLLDNSNYQSLIKLIGHLANKYNINPIGKSRYRGVYTDNILGHSDVGYTNCPGKNVYNILDMIKSEAAKYYNPNMGNNLSFTELNPQRRVIIPKEAKEFKIKIKNKSRITIPKGSYLKLVNIRANRSYIKLAKRRSEYTKKDIRPNAEYDFSLRLLGIKNVDAVRDLEFQIYHKNKKVFNQKLYISIELQKPRYSYEIVKIEPLPKNVYKGKRYIRSIKIKNTGNTTWVNTGKGILKIGTESPRDRESKFTLGDKARFAKMQDKTVKPGQIGTFVLKFIIPKDVEGDFIETFQPVMEAITWLEGDKITFPFHIYKPYEAKLVKSTKPNTIEKGKKVLIQYHIKNIGYKSWNPRRLRIIEEYSPKVFLKDLKVIFSKKEVKPNGVLIVNLSFTVPKRSTKYLINLIPKFRNTKLLNDPLSYSFEVKRKQRKLKRQKRTKVKEKVINRTQNNQKSISITFANKPITRDIEIYISKSDNKTQIIKADKSFKVLNKNILLRQISSNQEITFHLSNKTVSLNANGLKQNIRLDNKECLSLKQNNSNTVFEVKNLERKPGWNPKLNDNKFRDNLNVCLINNTLKVINILSLENYMKGLAETSFAHHIEKRKAIVILARSYARFYLGDSRKFPGMPYDLDDDPDHSQKYIGYGFEQRAPWHVKDVQSTRDKVVFYKNKVIKTPYFHSDDGRTRSAKVEWGWKNTPYLEAKDDPYCKGMKMSGHGVGMSGCGAQGFAHNEDKNYLWLIDYYFPGTVVK